MMRVLGLLLSLFAFQILAQIIDTPVKDRTSELNLRTNVIAAIEHNGIIYALISGGGVNKSEDFGASWKRIGDANNYNPDLYADGLFVHNDQVMLLNTVLGNPSGESPSIGGIYRLEGDKWKPLLRGVTLNYAYSHNGALIGYSHSGIFYRSKDDGKTWQTFYTSRIHQTGTVARVGQELWLIENNQTTVATLKGDELTETTIPHSQPFTNFAGGFGNVGVALTQREGYLFRTAGSDTWRTADFGRNVHPILDSNGQIQFFMDYSARILHKPKFENDRLQLVPVTSYVRGTITSAHVTKEGTVYLSDRQAGLVTITSPVDLQFVYEKDFRGRVSVEHSSGSIFRISADTNIKGAFSAGEVLKFYPEQGTKIDAPDLKCSENESGEVECIYRLKAGKNEIQISKAE